MARLLLLLGMLGALGGLEGFYLPGLAPHDYTRHSPVEVAVNALTPMGGNNQEDGVKSLLPYDYYDRRLGMCVPTGGAVARSESLGSILFGDRIYSSPLNISMLREEQCKVMCHQTGISGETAKFVNARIREQYGVNWLVDGLPAARKKRDERTEEVFYSRGFELGEVVEGEARLHNHYDIHLEYHTVDEHHFRVVGVLVWPHSRRTRVDAAGRADCGVQEAQVLGEGGGEEVVYTYSVHWEASEVPWATRWDAYLHVVDAKIHWLSVVNSFVIVVLLSGMVGMVLVRALHKDMARYNTDEAQEDLQEEFGWKLVHGDVFRRPGRAMLLSVFVGNGAQLVGMGGVTLGFAVLGFLSPSNRGSLVTAIVVLYMLFGGVAGYVSARTYRMVGGERWRGNILLTALLFPGAVFGTLLFLNFFLIGAGSAGAVPFGTLLGITALWFLVSVPLTCGGALLGLRKGVGEFPVRTNQIPRQIPEQATYLKAGPMVLLGGILPFGAIFIELYFILSSLWSQRVYYVFGFLTLVSGILVWTVGEVAVLLCYFQLCAEDYRWWWRSFLTGGSVGLYIFGYSMLYYWTRLGLEDVSSRVLYFGWMGIISVMVFVAMGSVGFAACLWFTQKIYKSIKVD